MICCDKCQKKQEAEYTVAWVDCGKIYLERMSRLEMRKAL